MIRRLPFTWCVVGLVVLAAAAGAEQPFTQEKDVVIADVGGLGLPMDIFRPTGEANGLGIIDIASGAWFSDRGKIRDHQMAQFYSIFCSRGYTVFAVRPGSISKFTGLEMVANVKTAIRYVKQHASDYNIDPERLGLAGASAGAHLAALTTVMVEPGNPESKGPAKRHSTEVAAVGIFFPPTNFLEWGEEGLPNFERIGRLFFAGGVGGHSEEEVLAEARKVSPALNVNGNTPPFIIWHGDADPLVPLQQSEFFVEKLKEAGTDVELHVKPGGAHPWLTIAEEVGHIADWFDAKLGAVTAK